MFCCTEECKFTRDFYYQSLGQNSSYIGSAFINIYRIVRGYGSPSQWSMKDKILFLESALKAQDVFQSGLIIAGFILGAVGVAVCFSLGGMLAPGLNGRIACAFGLLGTACLTSSIVALGVSCYRYLKYVISEQEKWLDNLIKQVEDGIKKKREEGPSASFMPQSRMGEVEQALQILGLHKPVTKVDVTKAYRKLALRYHPDRNKAPNAEAMFKIISNAYSLLSNLQGDVIS